MRCFQIMKNKLSVKAEKYYEDFDIDTSSKYFRMHFKNGLLDDIDENYISEIQKYFLKNYKQKIDPITHIAYSNLTGKKDVKIIPQDFFRKKFLNVFNDNPMNDMYRDKSLYDILFDTEYKVHNVLKYTRGKYFDKGNNLLNDNEAFDLLISDSKEYIIKPSDTNNGIGIKKMSIKDGTIYLSEESVGLKDLTEVYGYNFVIQRIIQQHEVMAKPHPSSVNTLRIATLRWNGEILVLYTFARFGTGNDIKDNAGSGGLVVGVKDSGQFMNYGVINSDFINEHPTTGVKIKDFGTVPNYEVVKEFVRELHSKVTLQDYIAWDIAIDKEGSPVFIEPNFYGSSWVNQI